MSLLFFPKTSSLSSHTIFMLQIRYMKTRQLPPNWSSNSQLVKLSHEPQLRCFAVPLEKFLWTRMWLPLVMMLSSLFPNNLMIAQATLCSFSTRTADLGGLHLGVYNRRLMWRFCSL